MDTSSSNFFQPSSHIALDYKLFCSRTIADRFYYDGLVEKKLDVFGCYVMPIQWLNVIFKL